MTRVATQSGGLSNESEYMISYGWVLNTEELKGERADYGKQIVASLAKSLTAQFGRGWSKRNLFQMVRFAELFPDQKIVQTLSAQLSWSHFVALTSIEDRLKREFFLG